MRSTRSENVHQFDVARCALRLIARWRVKAMTLVRDEQVRSGGSGDLASSGWRCHQGAGRSVCSGSAHRYRKLDGADCDSPGRNNFQPEVSLVYSTGHGNGPFGLGWALSLPGVARDTAKAFRSIPMKRMSSSSRGRAAGSDAPSPDGAMLYRPRTEGAFARIQHRISEQDDYWEVRSRNGLTSLYGDPAAARNGSGGRAEIPTSPGVSFLEPHRDD